MQSAPKTLRGLPRFGPLTTSTAHARHRLVDGLFGDAEAL